VLLNHASYRAERDQEARKEYRANWMREKRQKDREQVSEQNEPPCTYTDTNTNTDTNTVSSKDLSEKSDVIAKKKSYPDDFLEFWKLYPSNRRGSKPNALAAWKKMDADASTLISDIQDRFINDERFVNDEFIPHAERWIKNCEFESQGKPPSRFGDVTDKNIRTISSWMEK